MKHYLIEKGYIPLDKSWIIRVGMLDLLNGCDDAIKFLEKQDKLSDDLQALYNASINWESGEPIDVGESGTLYRFLKFASWKSGKNKEFILHGTLQQRKICDNPEIINYSLKDLLNLDNGTSQWASASVLLGNQERVSNPPYKLELTYEAVSHWKKQRANGKCWIPRYDKTILKQATAFLELLKQERITFIQEQAEDYCFARTLGLISKEEGESLWPSLRQHESDRILGTERALENAAAGKEIDSKDHRIVQSVAMLQKIKNKSVKIKHPSAVNKSWPQFWRFMNDIDYNLSQF